MASGWGRGGLVEDISEGRLRFARPIDLPWSSVLRLRHTGERESMVPFSSTLGRVIFVVGSGRSGTHWLGHILASHPDLHVTIEDPRFFTSATAMAMNPQLQSELLPELVRGYRAEAANVAPKRLADKSHPNIWHAEQLLAALPEALFVGIQRDPWGTSASMLQHTGVLGWHRRWREFPVPNRFLGITEDVAYSYDELSEATRCALRWKSHHDQMRLLQDTLGEHLLVVDYKQLILEPAPVLEQLVAHLSLSAAFPTPETKSDSLDRWRNELADDQIDEIASIVGFRPDC